MATRERKLATVWEAVGHVHLLSWLVDLAKIVVGPVVGAVTLWSGINQIPVAYLIVATTVALAATTYVVNQFAALYGRKRTGFTNGLAYLATHMGFDPGNENGALQLGIILQNVAIQPIVYRVRRFDVVIGDRTIALPLFATQGGVIPRGVVRTYRYPAFAKAAIAECLGQRPNGSITFEIEYGHAEGPPVRMLKMTLSISMRLDSQHGVSDIIVEESDEEL